MKAADRLRPAKLNALNGKMIGALMAALDKIELDRSVRAVVITGARRAFSAGADIAEFQAHMKAGPGEAVACFMRRGHRLTRRIESFPKPIIGAVNGLAFGGGCELVEAIHVALAAERGPIRGVWIPSFTADVCGVIRPAAAAGGRSAPSARR